MKHRNKYDRIEDAICKLEKIICDELDIDLGDEILKPLDDWSGLRNIINNIEVNKEFGLVFDVKELNKIRRG
tara:strand:+ start:351 stop:566 length:216 start_codon:yes stop_codon:yes gene_type:complete